MSTGVDARPALALGGGVGGIGDVCGAVSGGAVAIGQLVGDHMTGDLDAMKAKARDLAMPYRRDFEARFGNTECNLLTGFDHATAEGRAEAKAAGTKDKTCVHLVVFAVQRLLPLREEFAS